MAQTCGNILLHIIFSTKQRQPFLTPEIRPDLCAYLGGIVRGMRGAAIAVNGTSDHVHLLLRARPIHSVAEIVRTVKANSSKWMREKGHHKFGWQAGYGAFSVSESNVAALSRYIARQEVHHKKRSFQEEYVSFLRKNKVVYDERYVLD